MYLVKTNHENTRKCDNYSSHICIVIKNSAVSNILFDKRPTVLTDMLMLKRLGFTEQDISMIDKTHSFNMAAKAKHIQNPGKKGWGATKTLTAMTRTHPTPSARESILVFFELFNRCHWIKLFYGFDRAVVLWIS